MLTANHNPDVLSCLANLSNDEVFTPPAIANAMLDLLPQELFKSQQTTFLDPACKSGVFLREIAKRLIVGLQDEIPDVEKRLDHIFKRQLFGIAITELTAQLSRRSVYCSKAANGRYSVVRFEREEGNIRYVPVKHSWVGGRCVFCGASQGEYDRGDELESHAYQFIHAEEPKEIFKMKFDVIVGNPPYQLGDGGNGASARPLYHLFVEQAKKMSPRYITMIIPARWYAGGKGLDDFRRDMLHDERVRTLVDFFDSTDCFPGVDISGGVCYFLWNQNSRGKCKVVSHRNNNVTELERFLLGKGEETFIRFNEAVNVVDKVKALGEELFYEGVSARKPFGFDTKPPMMKDKTPHVVKIYAYPENGYVLRSSVVQNESWVDEYKVCVARSYGERGDFPYLVIGKPFIAIPGSCCSETYIVIRNVENESEANNVISYMKTKFFRFLVLLIKNTQDAPRRVYQFVPMQDFSKPWTDAELYAKYGLTQEEIDFVESMIRPME